MGLRPQQPMTILLIDLLKEEKENNPNIVCGVPVSRLENPTGSNTVFRHRLNCKRRLCPDCGWWWAWSWRRALADKSALDEKMGLPKFSRAVTLTTAYDPGYEKAWVAIKLFWRFIRAYNAESTEERMFREMRNNMLPDELRAPRPNPIFPHVEYFGVVEYNQAHTQPHFHFVLSNDCFIHWTIIRDCWMKAQRWAHFDKIAFDIRIEEINSDVARYFTKYITKAGDGKDEIPRRSQWRGRFIRYSKRFFRVPLAAVKAALNLQAMLWHRNPKTYELEPNAPFPSRSSIFFDRGGSLRDFDFRLEHHARLCEAKNDDLHSLMTRPWNPTSDVLRADPLPHEMWPTYPLEAHPFYEQR